MTRIIPGGTLPHPGHCLICGNASRHCIDFGPTQPWNGAMLVCILCFRAIALEHAEILTLASKNDLDAEIATVEFMSRQISQIEEAKKALNDGIAAAFDDFNRVLNTDISIKSNGHSIPGL